MLFWLQEEGGWYFYGTFYQPLNLDYNLAYNIHK